MTDDQEPTPARGISPRTDWEQDFAAGMAARRTATGMSQRELAKRLTERGLPFHSTQIRRIEDGERPIRLNEAFSVSDIFGTTIDGVIAGPSTSALLRLAASRAVDEAARVLLRALVQLAEGLRKSREAINMADDYLDVLRRETGSVADLQPKWDAIQSAHVDFANSLNRISGILIAAQIDDALFGQDLAAVLARSFVPGNTDGPSVD